ncbi:Na antiporter NhaA 2 protein [Marine Group I thaumarchaeote SCGC RSA3]|uniref:Na antiporter NhaA 2 protein n=3 Tax=Marine Group I TaxID=905826 RepID=A0A081RM87_9ARCH|nr:Na antiporter NhaA 2 protein [Marine Group I thaumarchaeote SCGC AAA799-N04]KFM15917.1 Na antiporter NhaA 2 protein [Marine Group I thaumarchaeote SCGC AAA799-D11]KFM17483.1 Na antiporter NhaA 2 protein [Marine Group I thaumarchaeote SCGC RSA3]
MLVKTFVKNNLVLCVASIVLVVFFLGYVVGVEVGQDTVRKQELANLEQRLAEFKDSKSITPSQISKDDDPLLGDPDAPLSIIEFSNFQCKFCLRFYSDTLPLLKTHYIDTGKVNLIYRDFPIPKIYDNSMPAALASECANEQGKFWEYHDILFENQHTWRQNESDLPLLTFKQFANTLALNQEKFDSCLDSGKYADEINSDVGDGRDYAVSGTPTFFVGNDKVGYSSLFGTQSFSDFQKIIDEKLEQ